MISIAGFGSSLPAEGNAAYREAEELGSEIARRGGMLGISFYEHHLRPSGRATLDDIVRHAVHLARAAGGPEHVGVGSDLDGGFDAKHSAMQDTRQFTDLSRKLRKQFSASQVEGVMGTNWLGFLAASLPLKGEG